MTSKKISELAKADFSRGDDLIPVSTGLNAGETPSTKKMSKALFSMSEGAGKVYSKILSLEPIHYWPMELPFFGAIDEITGDVATITPDTRSHALQGPSVSGATRNLVRFDGTIHHVTSQQISISSDITCVSVIRSVANGLRIFGCSSSNDFQGWRLFVSSAGGLVFRVGTGSGFVDIATSSAIAPLLKSLVVVWTFDTTDGHKIYVNNVLAATSANVTPISPSTLPFQLGHGIAGTVSAQYNGTMQDVAIFDKVLTPTEILELSNMILGV
jgi:hypothetical protein